MINYTKLRSIPYFSKLDSDTLQTIAQVTIHRNYNAGELVLIEGQMSSGFYVAQSGWLKIVKLSTDGREHILNFIEPGDTFNVISTLAQVPNPSTVISLEPTEVWIISAETMRQLIANHPCLAQDIIQILAQRVLHLVSMTANLSLQTVETRLARLILKNAGKNNVIQRRQWATQSEIASRLGTVPDVLGRTLQIFVTSGLIEFNRREIKIINRVGLEEKALHQK